MVDRMANSLRADPQSCVSAQFFQAAQTEFSIGEKHVMRFAVRRAEIDELVEIVLNARLAQDRR